MNWDPQQYDVFAAHREQAFSDLLARVEHATARSIVDAGCGTGRTTHELARRWPQAHVVGVDASLAMLARARPDPRITFEQADLTVWEPAAPLDLVVSNAVLHWLPDPAGAVERLAGWVASGGVLAFQVPAMQGAPSHQAVADAARADLPPGLPSEVRKQLASLAAGGRVLPLDQYAHLLEQRGFAVDAWSTTYRMRLPVGGVLAWLEGTTLRPYIAALGNDAQPWLDALAARLAAVYPGDERGVVYPFRRLFVVGRRPA